MSDMLRRVALMMQKSVVVTYATWDSGYKDSNITLSSGNLTASASTAVGNKMVRSTISKSSGKWYWEITCTTVNTMSLGLVTSSAATNSTIGGNTTGIAYRSTGDIIYNGGVVSAVPATYSNGDVIGFAYDATGGTFEVFKNNVSQGSYTASPTAPLYAGFSSATSVSGVITANFGASAFVYSPPSGYNSGLYV